MTFVSQIVDAIGEFDPSKLDAIRALSVEVTDGEWPLSVSLQLSYPGEWIISLKMLQVRRVKLPILGGGPMELGEPLFCEPAAGPYAGLSVFGDELQGYQIVCGEIVTMGVRRSPSGGAE